jgi:hypothetical protein
MMEHWELVVGGLALAAALWSNIRSLFAWVRGLFVVTVWLDSDVVATLTSYVAAHGRRLAGETAYEMLTIYVRSLGRVQSIPVEWLSRTSSLLWLHGRPMWLTKADKALVEHAIEFRLSVLRGTVNIPDLLVTVAQWVGDRNQGGMFHHTRHKVVYHHGVALARINDEGRHVPAHRAPGASWSHANGRRMLHWDPADVGGSDARADLTALVSMPEIAALTDDIREWFGDRTWYRDHAIPWRMGLLYEGAPGTGKTSHARAIAHDLDLPVHVFDLATMSNEDLRSSWSKMVADAPCVALIEDFDAVFDSRTNISPQGGLANSGGLTFDALLNAIDGVERHDGVLLVITTNHADKIDAALRDRKGRIDRVVHFEPLDLTRRLELARRIIDNPLLAATTAHDAGDMPASKFSALCCRVALDDRRHARVVVEPVRLSEYR